MNRMICALARGDLLQDGLEALLELAAVLRAGDQRADVEREDALVLQALGDVAAHDALREALDDRGLADAGLADEDRVVLRAARQDLDHAADLLVAADDRVDLALARELGEVAAVLLEDLVLVLRVRVGHALVAADVLQRGQHALVRDAEALQRLPGVAVVGGHREQQVLGGDVLVAERLRLLLRLLEHAAQARGRADLHVARDLRLSLELGAQRAADLRGLNAQRRQHARNDAALLFDQRRGEVLDVDLVMAVIARTLLRVDERFL